MRLKFWRPPFYVSPEERVFENVKKFLNDVVKAVEHLDAGVDALVANKRETCLKAISLTSESERAADSARRDIERAMFEGRFFDKGEKIGLMETIDDIADNAELAAKVMGYRRFDKIPKDIADTLIKFSASTRRVVVSLRHAVVKLYTNFTEVPRYADMVEKERDATRDLYDELLAKIYNSNLSAVSVLLLRDLAFRILRVADSAEEAVDRVSFLAVRYG